MVRFSKDEMRDELRTIFLAEADHILIGAGEKAAEAFIGYLPSRDLYVTEGPGFVDLTHFAIVDLFDRAYDLAFAPTVLMRFHASELARLTVFMRGILRFDDGDLRDAKPRFMTPHGLCQTVCDTPIERTFGWISRCRRLARDHEATASSALAFFVLAAAMILVRRPARTV